MIKHIFCDLDGTLLKNFHGVIDSEDIEALKGAQEKGITISIATGRLDYEIKLLMEKYQLKGYRISQNGGIVLNYYDELIYEKDLETRDVKQILQALEGENVVIFFQTKDCYFIEKKLPIVLDFEKSQELITYIENPNIMNELDLHKIVTISLWAEENQNRLIKQKLDKKIPRHIESFVSSKFTLDITNADNSKGKAIKQICLKDNISLDEVAVIGDSHNDISMFEITKHSYAMNEADDEVKRKALNVVNNVKDAVIQIGG
jgi:hypothetical protein